MHIRLTRSIDGDEMLRRNALTLKDSNLVLGNGEIGSVVDVFENGEAYLVEFGNAGRCQWLGVLYLREVEIVTDAALAA